MWGGGLSHNGLTGAGRISLCGCTSWSTAFRHVPVHCPRSRSGSPGRPGPGLCAPAMLNRFARYAVRVWNIDMDFDCPMNTARRESGPWRISIRAWVCRPHIKELGVEEGTPGRDGRAKCTNMGKRTLPGIRELGKRKEEMVEIYRMAMGE